MIIKILLIIGVIGAVAYALRGTNSSTHLAIRRIGGALFALVAVLSILFPLSVTRVANWVNVGRGTDLVLYVFVVAFLYVTVALYQRMHQLEQKIIELTRTLALQDRGGHAPASELDDPEES